jgi:hypothetical protein
MLSRTKTFTVSHSSLSLGIIRTIPQTQSYMWSM